MTSLARTQGEMQAFLLGGKSEIASQVVETRRVPAETRLGIYRHAYGARLVDALRANHPMLARLLGEDQFAELGHAYVSAHDSHSFSVRQYGERFSSILPTPYLQQFARWEWTLAEVFDAADAVSVTVLSLSSIPPGEWSELCFGFHPAMRRLTLESNVPQVWKALLEEVEPPKPRADLEATHWLIWRRDLRTLYRSLGGLEAGMLDGAVSGASFGDLCTSLCVHCTEDEAPARAAEFLRHWIESGLIVEVRR